MLAISCLIFAGPPTALTGIAVVFVRGVGFLLVAYF